MSRAPFVNVDIIAYNKVSLLQVKHPGYKDLSIGPPAKYRGLCA